MDWDAKSYHRISEPQFQWGLEVLSRLQLKGPETVLDAGCGTGRLTAELLSRFPQIQVIAADQSPAMLKQAEAALLPRFEGRVRFLLADLCALPLAQEVDTVFSTATFHWILDHDQLFQKLFAALRPAGQLVAQCGGYKNLEKAHRHAEHVMATPAFSPFFSTWVPPWFFADAESTQARLVAAGFTDVRTWLSSAATPFPDEAELSEFLRTVVLRHHLARLPSAELQEEFLSRVVTALREDNPSLLLDYCRLNIQASRRI